MMKSLSGHYWLSSSVKSKLRNLILLPSSVPSYAALGSFQLIFLFSIVPSRPAPWTRLSLALFWR